MTSWPRSLCSTALSIPLLMGVGNLRRRILLCICHSTNVDVKLASGKRHYYWQLFTLVTTWFWLKLLAENISCSPALFHSIHMLIYKEDGRFTQKSFTITPSSLPPTYIYSRYCYVASVRTINISVLEQLDNSHYAKFLSTVQTMSCPNNMLFPSRSV